VPDPAYRTDAQLRGCLAQLAQTAARVETLQALLEERRGQAAQATAEVEVLRSRMESCELTSAESAAAVLAEAQSKAQVEEERLTAAAQSGAELKRLTEELAKVRSHAAAKEEALLASTALQTKLHQAQQRKLVAMEELIDRERIAWREERMALIAPVASPGWGSGWAGALGADSRQSDAIQTPTDSYRGRLMEGAGSGGGYAAGRSCPRG